MSGETKVGEEKKDLQHRDRPRRQPLVGIVCGSTSDFETVTPTLQTLEELEIPYSLDVRSAHRTPDDMREYAKGAEKSGYKAIIACAGGAVDLSGMIAAYTLLPVIGLPVKTSALNGIDSLYSMVQMPEGVPVGTMGIERGKNAALFAAEILATSDDSVRNRLRSYRENLISRTRTTAVNEISRTRNDLNLKHIV
jgi:phosphoribosylaminoimidazole carboxylase PurE protein